MVAELDNRPEFLSQEIIFRIRVFQGFITCGVKIGVDDCRDFKAQAVGKPGIVENDFPSYQLLIIFYRSRLDVIAIFIFFFIIIAVTVHFKMLEYIVSESNFIIRFRHFSMNCEAQLKEFLPAEFCQSRNHVLKIRDIFHSGFSGIIFLQPEGNFMGIRSGGVDGFEIEPQFPSDTGVEFLHIFHGEG